MLGGLGLGLGLGLWLGLGLRLGLVLGLGLIRLGTLSQYYCAHSITPRVIPHQINEFFAIFAMTPSNLF